MALAPIAQDVQAFSQKLGLSTDLTIIEHAWNLELGGLRGLARITALHGSTLVIDVDSHTVMHELTLRRKELIRKVNKHLPHAFLDSIQVRLSQHDGR